MSHHQDRRETERARPPSKNTHKAVQHHDKKMIQREREREREREKEREGKKQRERETLSHQSAPPPKEKR